MVIHDDNVFAYCADILQTLQQTLAVNTVRKVGQNDKALVKKALRMILPRPQPPSVHTRP